MTYCPTQMSNSRAYWKLEHLQFSSETFYPWRVSLGFSGRGLLCIWTLLGWHVRHKSTWSPILFLDLSPRALVISFFPRRVRWNSSGTVFSIWRVPSRRVLSPVIIQLHWLPVLFHINFKMLLLTSKVLHGLAPSYISDLIRVKPPVVLDTVIFSQLIEYCGLNQNLKH